MQRAFGLDIPQTLEDLCDPTRLALVVYDMQVGIVKQIENGQQITDNVVRVLDADRQAGLHLRFGTGLIWVTSLWLSKMPVVSDIAMRPTVRLPLSNSRAMLYLRT